MTKKTGLGDISLSSGVPISKDFADIYFSHEDGIGESQYNFLKGNNLASRFSHLSRTLFTVAETGFGTGLNFLLTAQLWSKHAFSHKKLHYISVEKHPIDQQTLADIYQQQQWQNTICEQILNQYQPDTIEKQTLAIGDNIELTLLFDDALTALCKYHFTADAWFLDGFAPAKNLEMWSKALFQSIAKHSCSSTTLATFTAASQVRKNIESVGFVVKKEKGFGKKRERLIGYFP